MSMRSRLPLLAVLAAGAALACAGPQPQYSHNRYDYWAFRGRFGALYEPNYLPYVTHWEKTGDGDALVLCRWPDEAFPLRYWVEPPAIPSPLQNEFSPRSPRDYTMAVRSAFRRWEEAIGRPVRFREADSRDEADVVVKLRAEMRPAGEALVGGIAGGGKPPCRVTGPGPNADQVTIRFEMREVELFIVDSVGLLAPRQVERIALHEIGHVLGASGQHSPLGGDLMYHMTDDSRVEKLSEHDLNTFRALYSVEPGSVYAWLDAEHPKPLAEARRKPPRLDRSMPDERFGFEVQLPVGWQRIRTPHGWVAVDGVSWDYDASLQVIAVRGSMRAFATRQARLVAGYGEAGRSELLEIDGQPVARFVVERDGITEETVILQWGEDWVILIVADCQSENFPLYSAWFRNVLLSLTPLGGS